MSLLPHISPEVPSNTTTITTEEPLRTAAYPPIFSTPFALVDLTPNVDPVGPKVAGWSAWGRLKLVEITRVEVLRAVEEAIVEST
jgi:hypothetical protein